MSGDPKGRADATLRSKLHVASVLALATVLLTALTAHAVNDGASGSLASPESFASIDDTACSTFASRRSNERSRAYVELASRRWKTLIANRAADRFTWAARL